jgi:hypothetical protein
MSIDRARIKALCQRIIHECKTGSFEEAARFALAHDLELLTVADFICEQTRLTDHGFHMFTKKYHELDGRESTMQPVLKPSSEL